MIQLPKHQIDGTNSGSRLKVGLTFGTLRKASWLVAKGLVTAEGPRTSRNLTGNGLLVEVPCARAGSQWKTFSSAITHDQRPSVEQSGSTPVCRQHCSHSPQTVPMTGKSNAHARVRVTTLITSLEDPAAWLSGQFRREFCPLCAASARNPESKLDAPPPAVSREPSMLSGLGPSQTPRRFPGRSLILELPPCKRCPPSLPRALHAIQIAT